MFGGLLFCLVLAQDGPYLPLTEGDLPSRGRDDRISFAFYYCRDDAAHPRELHELGKLGVDVALILGEDPDRLSALVRGLEELEKEARERPRIALALDPTASKGLDASTPEGLRRLYARIRSFYSRIPPRFWAFVDNRPMVWFLPPQGVRHDKGMAPALGELSKEDFKNRPLFVVADVGWGDAAADRSFSWGSSYGGPRDLPVVSVGPGSAQPERSREDGKFYERSWYIALRLEPRWIALETWNGGAEGTDLDFSKENKDKYTEMTQRYLRDFRNGEKTTLPKGKWTGASKVLYTAKYTPHEQGIRPLGIAEGACEFIQLRGIAMLASKEVKGLTKRILSFDVDDSFAFFEHRSFDLEVEFLDVGEGAVTVEYDAWDKSLSPGARTVKCAGERRFAATGDWRTERFDLPDARFGNLQPGGSDFRLVTEKRGIAVRRIALVPK